MWSCCNLFKKILCCYVVLITSQSLLSCVFSMFSKICLLSMYVAPTFLPTRRWVGRLIYRITLRVVDYACVLFLAQFGQTLIMR